MKVVVAYNTLTGEVRIVGLIKLTDDDRVFINDWIYSEWWHGGFRADKFIVTPFEQGRSTPNPLGTMIYLAKRNSDTGIRSVQ